MSRLIPTGYRFKIGAPWSYPIGAEAISSLLAQTPVIDALKLSFHERKGSPDRLERCYLVLSVDYRTAFPYSRFAEENGYDVPGWNIFVHAVPRAERAIIKRGLVEVGLPYAAKWLSTNRTETWCASRHSLSIHYDRDSVSLCVQEDGGPLSRLEGTLKSC